MKSTGIVRRIDELGRVVIPKEIRRTQHIRQGMPLEIYTAGDGAVIFRKYSPIGAWGDAGRYAEVLAKVTGCPALICDRDSILAAGGTGRHGWQDKTVSPQWDSLMERRELYLFGHGAAIAPCEGSGSPLLVSAPVLAMGDVIGAVALLGSGLSEPSGEQIKVVQAAAGFLSRQMED